MDKTKVADDSRRSDDDADDTVDVRCGYRKCRPEWLQVCNNSKMLLFIMSLVVFTQGFVVNGVFNVIVSTLERRFLLRSEQMGWIVSAYDFSAAFLGIIISYLGSGRYKARWITIGSVALFLGSIVMVLPHFTTDLYSWGQSEADTCKATVNSTSEEMCVASGLQKYIGVFALSNVIFGVGGATLYTVGTAFIDDSVDAVTSPLYMGIYFGFAALGPGVGFLVGGAFLKAYVDFDKVDVSTLSITDEDARWVGAWWVGPILSAIIFIFCIIGLSLFGAELPSAKDIRHSRESQLHKGSAGKLEAADSNRPEVKSLPQVFLGLLKNPPFVFTTLAGITEAMLLAGLSGFGAKYIQNNFQVPAGTAGLQAGAVIVLGLAGGISFGGFVCRCFRLRVKGMLKFAILVCAISTVCVFMFFLSCGEAEMAGVHKPYASTTEIALDSSCNSDCQCSTETFEVACDGDGLLYFSPCHAGCTQKGNGSEFLDCSCVPTSGNATVSSVTLGSCGRSCGALYAFLVVLFLYTFATIAADVPAEQAVLRSIPENHKSIMCGANRLFIRLIGTIPGQVLMGAATDAGCRVWQTECGKEVSCWVYDNATVSRNYFIIGIITKIFSLIFFFLAHKFYIPPKGLEIEVTVNNDEMIVGKENSGLNATFVPDSDEKGTHL